MKIRPEFFQACTKFEPKYYTGLNFFFPGLIFTTAQLVFITAKIAFILISLSAVHIHDFHIFTVIYP